jgi:uncharacterized protein YgiM (DUF1202 family)
MRLFLLLSVLVWWTAGVLAAPGDTLYVRGNNVNVRAAPSLEAAILRQVNYGYLVIEIRRQNKWIKVHMTRGRVRSGWIHGSLLALVPYRSGKAVRR